MAQQIVIQKIRKKYPTPIEVGVRYYSILSVLNNLGLTEREVQVLAFTAYRGTISSGGAKESFLQMFGSTKASLGNIIGSMMKRGLLIKIENRITVNPALMLNFDNSIILQISISSE